jgi:outer membrane protein OmpA-like peptidoglycan-associated protein
MKTIYSYSDFILEQDDKNPKKVKPTNIQKPSAIKRFFGLDKLSDYKVNKTDVEPKTGNTLIRGGKFRLTTISAIDPQPERIKDLESKGWTNVFEKTVPNTTKLPTEIVVTPPPIQIRFPTGNDYFEFGGFTLTQTIKDILTKEFSLIPPTSVIDKIQIESSTDKVKVTDNLKKILNEGGYSQDNQGLSNARATSIKNYLIEVGGEKIQESNFIPAKILFEQGKENPGPTGDSEARYIKLRVTLKPAPTKQTTTDQTKTEKKIIYFQKMFQLPKPCYNFQTGPDHCFTYS